MHIYTEVSQSTAMISLLQAALEKHDSNTLESISKYPLVSGL